MATGFYAAMRVLDYHKVNGTRDRDDTLVVAQIVPSRGREGSTGTYVEESNALRDKPTEDAQGRSELPTTV